MCECASERVSECVRVRVRTCVKPTYRVTFVSEYEWHFFFFFRRPNICLPLYNTCTPGWRNQCRAPPLMSVCACGVIRFFFFLLSPFVWVSLRQHLPAAFWISNIWSVCARIRSFFLVRKKKNHTRKEFKKLRSIFWSTQKMKNCLTT